jgi:hypothetical protein
MEFSLLILLLAPKSFWHWHYFPYGKAKEKEKRSESTIIDI